MKILIADDDPVSRRLLEAKLANWGYEVIVTRDGNEAWQALQAESTPRIAILDWMMPGMDGVDICRKIRESIKEPYIYILLLTAMQREEDVVSGMEAGADDYIVKPFKSNELKVRLRAGRRIVELQEELITAREALRTKASHDPLTGLWNHEEILRILDRELARADREGTAVGILMIDLDHFKHINDTFGHMEGDMVLRLISKQMLSLVRSYDAIGRYGGEEFLVVLPVSDDKCIPIIAERFRNNIESNRVSMSTASIPVTISLGAAVSSKERRRDGASLVRAADAALYRAKNAGRNRVELAWE